ncbi:MAG: hypothetical protein S4CHLAM2_04760 [Chlamydiales bacterium]|nr:hypothetical protein [Chlamydiales bacterium]
MVVIGETGVGKTSLVTLLATRELSFLPGNEGGARGVVHTMRSEPTIPVRSLIAETLFWDCQYDDSQGITHAMANAVLIKRVINASPEVKVLIMVNDCNIMDDRGITLIRCADTLTRLFADHTGQVEISACLCVSKSPSDRTEAHIKAQMRRVIDEGIPAGDPKRTLLEAIRTRPILLFPKVEAGGVHLDVSQLCDGILATIDSMPYAS